MDERSICICSPLLHHFITVVLQFVNQAHMHARITLAAIFQVNLPSHPLFSANSFLWAVEFPADPLQNYHYHVSVKLSRI